MMVDSRIAQLLEKRNRAVGTMFASDRAAAYVGILASLVAFRRGHELEPLHEDVAEAVGATDDASLQVFNQDVRQLLDWGLVSQRIEKERLRGYRDTRRRKFRYRISDDAASFIVWLESRRQDDLHPEDLDTRDQLGDLIACLNETLRLINKVASDQVDYEAARAIFHRLTVMSSLTDGVAKSLGEFNLKLLSFVGGVYDASAAHRLIGELDRFLERFLKRVYSLRQEILPAVAKLRLSRLDSRWAACLRVMETESAATSMLMRIRLDQPAAVLDGLRDFYGRDGQIEKLLARVSTSARLLWQRLYAHLRELERRSHRLEDIRCRIADLAALPFDAVPYAWFRSLLASASLVGEGAETWGPDGKCAPPQPTYEKRRLREPIAEWLAPREPDDGAVVQSLDEQRLEALLVWMNTHRVMPAVGAAARLSQVPAKDFRDFAAMMDLARSGLLDEGRRLGRLGVEAEVIGPAVVVTDGTGKLSFDDVELKKR